MSRAEIITVTDPVELLKAQLAEIRKGNMTTRKEIERLEAVLHAAKFEEQRLQLELEDLLNGQE